MSKYILYGLKKTCLGVLERGEQGDDNGTGLKEGGGIEMSIYSASIYAMHALFRYKYLPSKPFSQTHSLDESKSAVAREATQVPCPVQFPTHMFCLAHPEPPYPAAQSHLPSFVLHSPTPPQFLGAQYISEQMTL